MPAVQAGSTPALDHPGMTGRRPPETAVGLTRTPANDHIGT
ncbi:MULTISPECIES: hypothetical protein [Nonomuraea]|uniref:Uncharacterized protein n=1 Tax=Nonomuraea mangrovi TaxID=2316207 RepID=A0ABW4T7K5_9ACTN